MFKVLKFGGTSLGNAERIRQAATIVRQNPSALVVLSAMSGVTNCLEKIARLYKKGETQQAIAELSGLRLKFETICYNLFSENSTLSDALEELGVKFSNIKKKITDTGKHGNEKWLLAHGEIITSEIFYRYMLSTGAKARLVSALDFITTGADNEPVLTDISKKLRPILTRSNSRYFITQGYICRNQTGEIDNLNRGGSDYTATLVGAAIHAPVIEIWTDIDGLHNNDPRLVEGTSPIRELSFDEAAELAYFGAKILHPSCVWPAQQKNIPLVLKNTLDPESQGTVINSLGKNGTLAIAAKGDISIVKIRSGRMMNAYGFLKRVFEVFENYRMPIDVITTSEISVSLTVDNTDHLEEVLADLNKLGMVSVENQHAIICVVGDSMENDFSRVAQIIQDMGHIPVKMISFGGGKNNITFVVPGHFKQQALNDLHKALFCTQNKTVIPCFSNNT